MARTLAVLVLSVLFLPGCEEQSTKAALDEMCSIPADIADDPKDIGPYLAERITNAEVIKLLETLDKPEHLHPILKKHGIDPQSCDLVTAITAKDQ